MIPTTEPGSVGSFTSMAPTAIITLSGLKETGLESRGSRIRYNILVALPPEIDSKQFKEDNFKNFIKEDLTLYHNTEIGSGSQRFINSTFDYMSLLGLSALVSLKKSVVGLGKSLTLAAGSSVVFVIVLKV